MTVPSKIAGGLSLFSCISDIHKTAVIYANKRYQEASSDKFISQSIGAQKADKISFKDANRKNWLEKNNFFLGLHEVKGRIAGYVEGVAQGVARYLPNFILAGLAIVPKGSTKFSKAVANISAIGLAGLEVYDFAKNSTNITQRTDYLKMKK